MFSISLSFHSFVYRSSSWRLYMMVHQGFNFFSKCSLRFFWKELKYSLSCILKCNSFNRIIRSGIMSFLIIWVHVFTIHMLSRMRYFKSINLFIGIILGYISPKPSLRTVANYGAYKWSKFFSILPVEIFFLVSLFLSIQSFSHEWQVVTSYFELYSIRPYQAYLFVIVFPTTPFDPSP